VGYIPFEDLPSVYNPDGGVIVTANQPVTSDQYPFLLTADFDLGHRAGRIHQLLDEATAEGSLVDAETMTRIQMDTYSAAAEIVVPYLLDLDVPAGYYGDGLRLLRDWDYMQDPESGAAAYFNAVWSRVLALTFHDELPEDQWPSGGGRWFEVVTHLLETPDDPYWDFIRLVYFFDPAPVIRELKVPTLALFGELDNNILPEKNREAWRAALEEGGHPDYELHILARANHIQLEAVLGNNAEMSSLRRFVPEYFATVEGWLAQRVDGLTLPDR
jgi:acyl-homoserine lactone acylase PvdQ